MKPREMKAACAHLAAATLVSMAVAAFPAAAHGSLNPAAAAIAAAGSGEIAKPPAVKPAEAAAIPAKRESTSNATISGAGVETGQSGRMTEASELAALQAQHALWKVKAEIAKLKAEVRRNEEGAGLPPGMPAVGPGISLQSPMPMQRPIERVAPMSADSPRVLSVRAFDGDYTAVLEVGGQTTPVQAGDTLDGGWKVVTIGDDGVKLANGKRVRMLRP
ncbi:type IV pilus biogenesis protein PilP [Cupriavidus gilardii J11]|uniref:Type IV pilus biogenesis protein PilP n=1 Tax=Cupriavidus gilardii J11 TaxID=936133 RepID=A0A562BRW3_9BURK|nr:type IV pilus biogenesis protein PilP [Cupriavidus gilardii]TWG87967.1 type IV pilus biogenesis protein PilP [Cupriavidus gilardii J11]